ncbi:uncharacterized protein LOC128497341 [Spea bombifrons]|uniref:uncharacterized protein LOC128497341 n=1 Tax=Spea bombifrons TaxID=233779 RepID=UPI002349F2EB|nr:uncharacterized protein LOC128497341 [Spea bombifrons]
MNVTASTTTSPTSSRTTISLATNTKAIVTPSTSSTSKKSPSSGDLPATTTPAKSPVVERTVLNVKIKSSLSPEKNVTQTINEFIQKACAMFLHQFNVKDVRLTWGPSRTAVNCTSFL